jgi:Las17-binding protein actin regulator
VGRTGEAAAGVNAEIYSYSRARGLFAGVALDGTVLAFDRTANQLFYNDENATTVGITSGKDTTSAESARRFVAAVSLSANGPSATPATAEAPAAAPAAAPAPAPAPAPSGVRTFPMEDNKPANAPQ